MSEEYLHLTQILKMDSWQEFQDALAAVTKLAIVTVDYKGTPTTLHSQCTPYCHTLRSDARYGEYCKKCDAIGGLEAVRSGKPHIYLCHRGILDISIPILVNDQYLGAIMAGQVRVSNHEKHESNIDNISFSNENYGQFAQNPKMAEQYNQIPILTYCEIETITSLLFHMCNYLVEIAVDKQILLRSLHHSADESESHSIIGPASAYNMETLRTAKEKLSGAIMESYLKYDANADSLPINRVIKPAISYICNTKMKK